MADNSNIIDFHDRTFSSTLQDKLNQYRKEKKLTDVELKIGDKLFPSHRNVLSVGSPVLEAAFSENWTQSKIYPLTEHVDTSIVEPLLSFFYTGSIQLTPDNIHPVCVAAHFLQIPTLLDACVKGLSKQVTVDNIFTLHAFSISHELEKLRYSCLEFLSTEYENVFQGSQILQLSSEDFTDLIIGLKEHFGGTSLREHTFDCVVRWTEKNLPERLGELPGLLKNIPLEEVSYRFLTQRVFTHPLVKESLSSLQNILGTLKLSSFDTAKYCEQIPLIQDLIVIGGRKSSDEFSSVMNYYHADSQTWRRLPDMLQKRKNFAVTVSNQRDIIVGGGFVEVNGLPQRTSSVEMFTWETHTWQKLSDMVVPEVIRSMAIHDNHLYITGVLERRQSMVVHRYSSGEWSYSHSIHSKVCDGFLIPCQNQLYAIGSGHLKLCDQPYDDWTVVGFTPAGTKSVKATVHQDRIYAFGNDKFWKCNPELNDWTALPGSNIKGLKSLASLNDKLLAVSDSIYEFDLSTKQWKAFADIPSNIFPHYAVVGN